MKFSQTKSSQTLPPDSDLMVAAAAVKDTAAKLGFVAVFFLVVIAGFAVARQEEVKPERPALQSSKQMPELRQDCTPFVIQWWVQDSDGKLKLTGSAAVVPRGCHE